MSTAGHMALPVVTAVDESLDMHSCGTSRVSSPRDGGWTIGDTRGPCATRGVTGPSSCPARAVGSSQLHIVEELGCLAKTQSDVMTADEAADYLRVSRKTLYRLVSAGKIPGQKVGRSWRFRHADLVAFLGAKR